MFLTFLQDNGLTCDIRPGEIVGVADSLNSKDEAPRSILLLSTTRAIEVQMTREKAVGYIESYIHALKAADRWKEQG